MPKKVNTIAIIPARGGSKRLPGKNLMTLAGKPLIVHSINYALANKDLIDEVVVSTDDTSIAKVAIELGVKVVERPAELATDTATTVSALKHVLLQDAYKEVGNVVLLQATNPLRPKTLLSDAFQKYTSENVESLMTVTRDHHKFGKITDGKFVPYNYTMGQRSQDLDPLYYENGLLYITKASLILKERILGERNLPFIVDHPYANIDIDTSEDFELASFYAEKYQ